MEDKVQKLTEAADRIENKKNRIFFYLPIVPQASGGIGVVYEHVKTLNEKGFNAFITYDNEEKQSYIKPTWLGEEYTSLPHIERSKIGLVGPEDFLIIPEGMSNVMELTKDSPMVRIILCQSYLYVLGALMPGISWLNFGIKDVIVVTPTLENYINGVFGVGKFEIKTIRPSINEKVFKKGNKPKKPIVAISSRDRMMTTNVIKHFYSVYPQYKWVTFKEMSNLSRVEFAEALQECFLGVWLDRVAGFGTFPIECAKTNTPFIGLIPDIIPEYAKDNAGIWTNNILGIPDLIAQYFKTYLEDKEPVEVLNGIKELSTLYTKEDEEKNIEQVYGEYFSRRKNEIDQVIEKLKGEE